MKQWLTDNKIFFEFISTVLFGLASIALGVASYTVAQSQLKIARIQLEPHITVAEKYLLDEAGIAKETVLEIFNAGAPIYGFFVDNKVFYTVSTNEETFGVPVTGYYYVTFNLDSVTGKLAELRGSNNNMFYGNTYSQQINSDWNEVLGYAEVGRTSITRVVYETRE